MVKVLFFGTPPVAVPFLDWLIKNTHVIGVVCRPDEPAGRGLKLTPPPTKVLAEQNKIPVFQPAGPWKEFNAQPLHDLKADVGIAVAYGRILPKSVFAAPRLGSMNVHFSLLPKYRGAAPMQWALVHGETKTGVTSFWLEEGLDSGPIFAQHEIAIEEQDEVGSLRKKLIELGVRQMSGVIADIAAGKTTRQTQQGEPTAAPLLKKSDGEIHWTDAADKIVNQVRGLWEEPGVFTRYTPPESPAKQLKILKASVVAEKNGKPGVILAADKLGILVGTGEKSVRLIDVQPEGKKPMQAWAFWQGARLKVGDKFEV